MQSACCSRTAGKFCKMLIHIELSRTYLQREDADAGAVGEDDVSVYDFHELSSSLSFHMLDGYQDV